MEANEHEHVIEVTDLRRVYGGGFEAVRGVTFSVRRGEIFALLGTNGAGKTSTVELLEGLAAPAGGRVRVLGHDPYTDRAAVRPRTGVMLQEGGFPSELTVAETARMWAGCVSGARPPAEVLALVGLESKAGVRVKQLSGGQRRRLDLALALLGDPEVLFLDEPTTGLDAEGRRDTWELVSTLRDAGTTVLLTTHYLEEAEQLADRLAIMHDGRIATTGTPAEVTATQPSRITFELPEGYFVGDLPPLAELGVTGHETDGRTVRLRTRELQRAATGLLVWAERARVELHRLDVRSASLEEAFLGIAKEVSAAETAHTRKEYAA
ncbi:ABC transporter ATP-binding protein [Streptomyces sp. TRM S81-3]|uniref:ABC transporter ATP-binding protein n=1 Tax=Streptomyces griseicoloratus TaxID=2752516 RepID=A0A926L8N3_9ACTN|nr:ABC transporter ATP-binding protein [Streptomyces griseicoloratus]MBD0423434.1 ABC transporter ATP-binding protein [Streptomyces griseicoloratus]